MFGMIKDDEMCGRYRLTAKERWLSVHFNIDPEDLEWAARWNVAPTQEVATILQDRKNPKRRFRKMRWGLIPYWAKDASFGGNTINAVSETATEKPAFREPLRRRRCLIPADGFYEWKKAGSNKQAHHIGMADDGLFAFAGLWDTWNAPDGTGDRVLHDLDHGSQCFAQTHSRPNAGDFKPGRLRSLA